MDDIYAGFDLPEAHGSKQTAAADAIPSTSQATGQKEDNKASTALDAELAQAMQSLGSVGTSLTSLWGNFRRQSTTAYNASVKEIETRTEAAKKDLAPLMSKAKEEYTKFSEQARNSAAAGSAASLPSDSPNPAEPTVSFYGEVLPPPTRSLNPEDDSLPAASAFFRSLQSSIQQNPNVKNLQKNMKQFQQTSNQVMNHPEEFMNKATQYLNNAVKIVPPSASSTNMAGRGNDAEEKLRAVKGRKESLKAQLQTNQAILLVDPSLSEKEVYEKFVDELHGDWEKKSAEEVLDNVGMQKTLDALVSEKMTAQVFWTRYFFRVQQIEQDEARRKQVLESAITNNEDDFSWDMDEEDSPTVPSPSASSTAPALEPVTEEPKSDLESPTTEKTPRNSSEEGTDNSYAVISGPPSTTSSDDTKTLPVPVAEKKEVKEKKENQEGEKEEDEDSDWE